MTGTEVHMQEPRRQKVRFVAASAAVLIACLAAFGCAPPPPGVGAVSPYIGEASFNFATSNFEGRMVACTVNGGPVTVAIDPNSGFDQVNPFRVDVVRSDGTPIASRFVYQPTELLISPPLVLGTCFSVAITSPVPASAAGAPKVSSVSSDSPCSILACS